MYTTRRGAEITCEELEALEDAGLSEEEIARVYGITRQGLWKIRKKLGFRVRFRSDRGKSRVDAEKKRLRWNKYQRERLGRIGERRVRVRGEVVSLARHNAAMTVGRELVSGEVVRHRDGDVYNNSFDNLVVM